MADRQRPPDTKYFFYFGFRHEGLYRSLVETARRQGLDITMVSFISILEYRRKRQRVETFGSADYIDVFLAPPTPFDHVMAFLYFFVQAIRHDRIVVHVRWRKPVVLEVLKRMFGRNKVQYVIEFEGDPVSERRYLEEHPYKNGFYDDYFRNIQRTISKLEERLRRADGVIVVSETLRDLFAERYDDAAVEEKTVVIPTGVDFERIHPDESVRSEYRAQLGLEDSLVFVYLGNVHYSWQKIGKTLEVFDLIATEFDVDAFMLLLVREQDHPIVEDFIERHGISANRYLLIEVPHDEVSNYLNAADVGVVLRDDHLLTAAAGWPAKFKEYMAAGLTVLTTANVKRAPELERRGYGVVLDDLDDDDELLRKFEEYLEREPPDRGEIHDLAEEWFSMQECGRQYVAFMDSM